jgi:hypothetical protein
MKHITFVVLALATVILGHSVAMAQQQTKFEGEFSLIATEYMDGLMLSKAYQILIVGGTATIKHTTDTGRQKEDKGTVSLTIHSGIDPATKRVAESTGFVRVELVNSGWASDKFVTRIDLPFTAPPAEKAPKATFSATTTIEMLWRDILPDGLVRDSDPMGIRLKAPYQIKVTKNPFP